MSEEIVLRNIKKTDDLPTHDNGTIPVVSVSPGEEDGKHVYSNLAFDGENGPVFVTQSSANCSPGPHILEEGKVSSDKPEVTIEEQLEEDDEDETEKGACITKIEQGQAAMENFFAEHGSQIRFVLRCGLVLAYAVYFGYAMSRGLETEDQIRLLWLTCFAVFLCCIELFRSTCGDTFSTKVIRPLSNLIYSKFNFIKWAFIAAFSVFVVVFIAVDVGQHNPRNLISIVGYAIYIILLYIFSANPAKVQWRPVCWGLGIQFVFAILTIRTTFGYEAFKWLGDRVSEFLVHSNEGAKFVFGDAYEEHMFAFKVLPVVVFFSTAISVLYYLGVMQTVILKLAWVMQATLGTSAAESVNAAGNIFVGQTEAPLLIRPLIEDMSASELHAVMTGGFATIAGSVMASYILFGVKPNHLITASVMAAPAALAMSKLVYPETEKAKNSKKGPVMEKAPQQNVVEAASAGASGAISLVAHIAANIIAFIAMLAFVNATLEWIGNRVGLVPPDYPILTFQLICSYILWPFAFVMGVAVGDCRKVAELIGFKTFINEFVAYTELGKLIENREKLDEYGNRPWVWVDDDIYLNDTKTWLRGGVMEPRSMVISTYALCGFANMASIGMVMGALGSMSEKQKPIIARLAVRAMVTGNVVCFMNACIAGLLYQAT